MSGGSIDLHGIVSKVAGSDWHASPPALDAYRRLRRTYHKVRGAGLLETEEDHSRFHRDAEDHVRRHLGLTHTPMSAIIDNRTEPDPGISGYARRVASRFEKLKGLTATYQADADPEDGAPGHEHESEEGIAPPPVEDTVLGDPDVHDGIMTRGFAHGVQYASSKTRGMPTHSDDFVGGALPGPAPGHGTEPVNALPAAPRARRRDPDAEHVQMAAWGAPLTYWRPGGSQQRMESIRAHGEPPLNGNILYKFTGQDHPIEPIAGMAGKTGSNKSKKRPRVPNMGSGAGSGAGSGLGNS